jgi:hypothetical protein
LLDCLQTSVRGLTVPCIGFDRRIRRLYDYQTEFSTYVGVQKIEL